MARMASKWRQGSACVKGVLLGLDLFETSLEYQNGNAKWPTCNSNDEGFCNGGELLRMVRVGYMTYFQEYEWYDDLVDGKLKEEALKQKAIYERTFNNHEEKDYEDIDNLVRDNASYHTNEEEEQEDEDRCELLGNPH
ncbi:hypothetical protein Tco_0343178 [Tanacetum coccineum]